MPPVQVRGQDRRRSRRPRCPWHPGRLLRGRSHRQGPAYINTYQRGPQESVWETSRTRPARLQVRRPQRLPGPVHPGHLVRQAVAVHRRPRRRRPRHPGGLLGATPGPRRRARSRRLGATVAKAAQDGRLPAVRVLRQVLQEAGCTSAVLRRGHRQEQLELPAVLVLRVGRRDRHATRAGRGGSAPATTTPATRTRWPPGRCPTSTGACAAVRRPATPTGRTSLTRQLEFYTWLQSAEGAIAGGATNSWDGALRHAAGRYADVLRHGLRLAARLPRPAVEPVVRLPGVVAWSGSRSTTTPPATPRPRRCSTSGSPGRWPTPRSTRDGTYQIPSTLHWTGAPADLQRGRSPPPTPACT